MIRPPHLILCACATLFPISADVTTRFLDEMSLPTEGVITGGLTSHLDHYYYGSEEPSAAGLWVTDGTTLGTWRINDELVAAEKISAPPYLFYWVDEDLYRTDGTPDQETLIVEEWGTAPDHIEGLVGGLPGAAYWLESVSGATKIWRSQGQENDATLFSELQRNGAPSFAGLMVADGEHLAFFGPDEISDETALWAIDVEGNGPHLLDTDICRDEAAFFCDGLIYYTKKSNGELRLFRSTGDPGTATEVVSGESEPYKDPVEFLVDGDTVYFQADDPDFGTEVWTVSSAAPTAVLLADLNPGGSNASPVPLAVFKDDLYSMARVSSDWRLWQIPLDGVTPPAIVDYLPEDIEEDYFFEAVATEDTLFLVSGPELASEQRWLSQTDGTPGGTDDLNTLWLNRNEPVQEGWTHVYPAQDAIIFASNQFATGTEIYTWKPMEDVPELVKDGNIEPFEADRAAIIQPTPNSFELQYFTITHNNEHEFIRLGPLGRRVLRDGPSREFGFDLTANLVSGTTFFRILNDGLWSVRPGSSTPNRFFQDRSARADLDYLNLPFATTGEGIIFLVTEFLTGIPTIYESNGINSTFQNTRPVLANRNYQDIPVLYRGDLHFVSLDPTFIRQPWFRDVSSKAYGSFFPGAVFGNGVNILATSEDFLYYTQPGGSLQAGLSGSGLWVYNGFNYPYRTGPPSAVSTLLTPPAVDEDGRLFYIGLDGSDQELWVTDGSLDGAEELTDIQPKNETGAFADLTTIEDTLFFAGRDEETGFELWMSDGTVDGTVRLTDLRSGVDEDGDPLDSLPGTGNVSRMAAFGDHVYFAADDGMHGIELWRVHSSGAPVEMVQDLVPGPGSSDPHNFMLVNDRLLFQAIDPSYPLVVLREVVDEQPFEGQIEIRKVGPNLELRFGDEIENPYFLMESADLFRWQPIEAFTASELNQENVRVYPREEFGRYYRLQRN